MTTLSPHFPQQFQGVFPALITPFTQSGDGVDFDSLAKLVELQIAAGVDGLVVCGSTGEALTLTDAEYAKVLQFVVHQSRGRVPCIGGVSQSSTARAVEAARIVHSSGCAAVLVATPPYNKPNQVGIALHMREIAKHSSLPVIAYNIPGRSAASISPTTLGELAKEGTICAVKESSGSLDTVLDVLSNVSPTPCTVFSGEDAFTFAVLAHGGHGVISASANALPHEFVKMYAAWKSGDLAAARAIQFALLPRIRHLFIESNPVPVKSVLAWQGVIAHGTVRAPLTPLSPSNAEILRTTFKASLTLQAA
jgi:4-hydroxy-tetrahydrodipicolinate synthase